MLSIGSCPSHYSPNDVISLSVTSNVHGQEIITSIDQRASELEAYDTSILHHAFISIFIALWVVITHYVTILMHILSYFTRFT